MRLAPALVLLCAAALGAQPARPGPRPVPADFDFLVGEWDFVETFKGTGPGGRAQVRGRWTGRKIADGSAIADEFRVFGPDNRSTEFLTATFRIYDSETGEWTYRGVDTARGRWLEGRGRAANGQIQLEQRGAARPDGSRQISRFRYYDIKPDRFSWAMDVSVDEGKTWITDAIRIEATRVAK
jgi:hypothetical protein